MLYINRAINILKGKTKTDEIVVKVQNEPSCYIKYKWKIITIIMMIVSLVVYHKYNMGDNIISNTINIIHMSRSHTYQIIPILDGFHGKGGLIKDTDLCEVFNSSTPNEIKSLVARLKSDVYKYEFLMLKYQCKQNDFNIPPDTFTKIASEFGAISRYGSEHAANPEGTNITVLSNDPEKGKTTTGAKGWHIDGTSKPRPDGIVFQHIITAPNKGYGGTQIISSKPMLELMKTKNIELYNRLNRLYVGAKHPYVHPAIGKHPITKNEYLCIHTKYSREFIEIKDESMSMLKEIDKELKDEFIDDAFLEKYDNDKRFKEMYSMREVKELLGIINEFIETECRSNNLIYVTDYEKGDLLIRDNWQLIHRSHPSAQQPPEEVGLRVMWRITTTAEFVPSKFP